ncbi:MAG: hypothetical protein J2P31_01055, partial [Blastocatellia bacterium]|nr:hypothetical protein [Blastocatellia bacterium]
MCNSIIKWKPIFILALQSLSVFALIAIPPDISIFAQKKPNPPPAAQPVATPSPAVEQVIELPQIAARAEELDQWLHEMAGRLAPDPTLNSIEQSLPEQEGYLRARRRDVDELIAGAPTLNELKDAEQDWLEAREQYAGWRNLLIERVKIVEADARSLADRQTLWTATLSQVGSANPIKEVLDRIRNEIKAIQSTRSKLNQQLTFLVTLQNRVSQQDQLLTDVVGQIDRAKEQLERSLLNRDGPPLWRTGWIAGGELASDSSLRRSLNNAMTRAWDFLKARRRTVSAIFVFFIIALGINLLLTHVIIGELRMESGRAAHLFRHPISLALLTSLIVALPLLGPAAPALIRSLLILLFMAPVLRFLPALIGPAARPLLYLLVSFGLTVGIWEILAVSQFPKREITALLSLAAIAAGAWLMRPARIYRLEPSDRKVALIIIATCAILVLITGSLLANIFGFVALSRVLRAGTTHSAYFAVILYTAYIAT